MTTRNPERYVTVGQLESELSFTNRALQADESEWAELLRRLLDEESERIESASYAARTWGGPHTSGTDDVPGPIRDGVIRLVRSRLERIQSDGLAQETLPTGQSASYRPPEDVRADVQRIARQHRDDSDIGAWVV